MIKALFGSADGRARPLLLISLALNLFFIGACGALAWRHYSAAAPAERGPGYWTPTARIERLAAVLPPADAAKLRAELQPRKAAADAAYDGYRQALARVRSALRAEPFNLDALRTAMADTRTTRQRLDEALHDVIASAGAHMSPEGRNELADWTPYRRTGNEANR